MGGDVGYAGGIEFRCWAGSLCGEADRTDPSTVTVSAAVVAHPNKVTSTGSEIFKGVGSFIMTCEETVLIQFFGHSTQL